MHRLNFSSYISVRPSVSADEFEELQIFDPSLLLLLPNSSSPTRICSSRILHLSLWLISSLDILLALLALSLNSLLTASIVIARPLPLSVRRSFSLTSVSYAFLAAILLAKKSFWLFSALSSGSPCASFVSSVGCKFQEFPVVAVYLHSLASSLTFSVQMYRKSLNDSTGYCAERNAPNSPKNIGTTATERRHGHWKSIGGDNSANAFVAFAPSLRRRFSLSQSPTFLLFWLCSAPQIALLVLCLAFAFLFTAFDYEPLRRKMFLVNCSLPLAVRQKEMFFALLTLMLCSQLVQSLLWQFVSASSSQQQKKNRMLHHSLPQNGRGTLSTRRPSLLLYLALSFRDLFFVEALLWSLCAFLTGSALLHQFVLVNPCGKCTRLMVELAFTTLPLIVSLSHPILSVLIVAPISYSTRQLCPFIKKALPEQEPATPPLPRPVPTVRILVTEHF
ncbi:hypothetical protein niasHT_013492 [Heterodera trifolii]|uniref:Uncharacterized protein n=1 Tax=Heterodera trifolii TaxID=157864 RepID=A0ABD2LCR8_9BILA